jgi:membrane-associated protease RseP (regulator of RpoE activity)
VSPPLPQAWVQPWAPARRRSGWNVWGRHLLLFLAAYASVFLAGATHGISAPLPLDVGAGLRLATALLSILMAHEMGHYLACRYYGVDATLPFFIPSPWVPVAAGFSLWMPISFVGTFGAVIRIRGRIPHRRALFDIGIAGPLAGFLVAVPVLIFGALEAQIVPTAGTDAGFGLGEPLLFGWIATWLRGALPDGQTMLLGPVGLAAWFGLFVTALNLIPIGQLDGGHVTYSLFRDRANRLSRFVWWSAILLIYFSPSWIFWAMLIRLLGRSHPPTEDDAAPLGAARVAVAVVGLLVFALCFTPNPVVWSWSQAWTSLREWIVQSLASR